MFNATDPSVHSGPILVFTSDRGGNFDVYEMALDGSRVRNITNNDAWDFVPDWSPGAACP